MWAYRAEYQYWLDQIGQDGFGSVLPVIKTRQALIVHADGDRDCPLEPSRAVFANLTHAATGAG